MKTFFKSKPIFSFIFLTFLITFSFWFLPVIVSVPKDIKFALIVLGACGPLLAGYILTVVHSDAKFKVDSKPIFFTVFVIAAAVLLFRMYLIGVGVEDGAGNIPSLNEISPLGYVLYGIIIMVVSWNYSNATNSNLKENYLRSSLFETRKVKWYIIGLLIFALLPLTSYLIGAIAGLETTDFIFQPKPYLVVSFFTVFFFLGGNEEFGWRGFLQKELQKKYNPLISSLIISFLWSLWHLPLHYNGFYTTGGFVDLLPRFLFTIPLTIIFTWLYNKSSYALLALVIMHTAVNTLSKAFGSTPSLIVVVGLLFAIFCLINDKMWKKRSFSNIYNENNE